MASNTTNEPGQDKPTTTTTTEIVNNDLAPKVETEESDQDKSKISIAELKAKCRELGIKGYSKKTKNEIIKMLVDNFSDDPTVQKIALLVEKVQELKKICHELGIRGYSKKKKTELVQIICNAREHQKEIEDQLDAFFAENTVPECLMTKDIILACYRYVEAKSLDVTLQKCMQFVSDQYPQIQRDITKILCKRIKKQETATSESHTSKKAKTTAKKEKTASKKEKTEETEETEKQNISTQKKTKEQCNTTKCPPTTTEKKTKEQCNTTKCPPTTTTTTTTSATATPPTSTSIRGKKTRGTIKKPKKKIIS